MPPKAKRTYKPRKSAPKAKKAYKPKAKGGRKPTARRAVGGSSKIVVRQQNLGQQTENKVSHTMGRPDSRAKIMKAVSPICHYVNTGIGSVSTQGSNGRQAWGYSMLSSVEDLNEIGLQLSAQNQFSTSGQEVPPATYLLAKLEHKIKFANTSQANCRLSIIHCRAKRDMYNSMSYTAPSTATYTWSSIVDAVQQGIASAFGGTTTGDVNYLIPGMDETESPIFNRYFQKIKTTEVFLAVGGCHTLQTNISYDRVLDASVYGNDSLNAVLGVSEFLLFKCEGQTGVRYAHPLAPVPEEGTITIAPCQVGFTQNWDYSLVQVANARRFGIAFDPITANGAPAQVISGSTGSGVVANGLVV